MQAKSGALFCAEHLTASTSETPISEDERIPCPLDPAHSVYKSKLTKHLKKCNARNPTTLPAFHMENCNLVIESKEGDEEEKAEETETSQVSKTTSQLAKIVLLAAHSLLPADIKSRSRSSSSESVSETEKHRLQQSALAQKILATADASAPLVFIEMGAGKGGLSSYLWETHIRDDPVLRKRSSFILIDRSNSRCKKDAKMKHEGAQVERIFIDIKDLSLAELVRDKCPAGARLLFISKHLCGAATCLTINALKNFRKTSHSKITLAVALCCHQCCAWNAYPNRTFLAELVQGEGEFKKLKAMTSWAVCGRIKEEFEWDVDDEEQVDVDDDHNNSGTSDDDEFLSKKVKLSPSTDDLNESRSDSKREIGRLTKRLLDYGRLLALKEAGFEGCELVHYVPEEITLENALLLATINH